MVFKAAIVRRTPEGNILLDLYRHISGIRAEPVESEHRVILQNIIENSTQPLFFKSPAGEMKLISQDDIRKERIISYAELNTK